MCWVYQLKRGVRAFAVPPRRKCRNGGRSVARSPRVEVDDDTLDRLVALNLLAPVRLLRAAFPHLAASASRGGEPFVVNVSAVVAEQPTAGMAAYSATKAALAGAFG